jgi:hypothetical protein
MNQVATFNPGQVPAFARTAELTDLAKSLSGSGGGFGKRISIKGGVFRLYDAGKEIAKIDERHLDVVVCAAAPKISRMFYAQKYVEDEVTAPSCWSADGDTPDASIKAPQHANCVDCPQNVKGSGENDSRACRFSQRLAVVLANDVGGNIMQLQLPAQSLFGKGEGENRPLQAYARFLASQKINPDMVVTRLKFDTDAAVPKLFFLAQRWLQQDEYDTVVAQGKSEDAQLAVTMSVFQVDTGEHPETTLPGARPKLSQTPPAAKTEPEPPAPAKRAKPETAPAVAPRAALDALVSQWAADDEPQPE